MTQTPNINDYLSADVRQTQFSRVQGRHLQPILVKLMLHYNTNSHSGASSRRKAQVVSCACCRGYLGP